VTVDVDKIIDNIKFVMMGSFEAKKGRWGGFTDLMYLDVGSNKSGTRDISIGGIEVPGTASASVNYDLKGWIWTIAGEYALVSQPGMTMDVFAGARVVDLEQDINWDLKATSAGFPHRAARASRTSAAPTGTASSESRVAGTSATTTAGSCPTMSTLARAIRTSPGRRWPASATPGSTGTWWRRGATSTTTWVRGDRSPS